MGLRVVVIGFNAKLTFATELDAVRQPVHIHSIT